MRLFWKIISSYHQIVDDKIINNIRMNCKYLEFIQELKTGCMTNLFSQNRHYFSNAIKGQLCLTWPKSQSTSRVRASLEILSVCCRLTKSLIRACVIPKLISCITAIRLLDTENKKLSYAFVKELYTLDKNLRDTVIN